MKLQKNYKATLTEEVLATTSWEIEIKLSIAPESDTWFILIEPGVSAKEESCFYHRRVWNSVFIYWVNRDNPTTHDINVSVMLTNSIDSFNYILDLIHEEFLIFKKDLQNVIIKWWRIYEEWTLKDVSEIDTSLWGTDQVLIIDSTNYVYIENWLIKITNTDSSDKYLIATIVVGADWEIESITKETLLSLKWIKWNTWASITSASFEWNDIVLTKDDTTTVVLINGKTILQEWNTDWNTVWNTLNNTVWNTLNNTVWNTLWNTLNNTEWNTLNNTLGNTVGNTEWNTIWTAQWKWLWAAWSYLLNDSVSYNWNSYVANINTSQEPPHADWTISAKGWTNAPEVLYEFSIDGSTLWHTPFAPWDFYQRISTDNGATWSNAIKFVWLDWEWIWDMLKSENLFWLADNAQARANLWLWSAAQSAITDFDTAWSAAGAEINAKNYADSLAPNYDVAWSAASAEVNSKSYADWLVVWLIDDRWNYNASTNSFPTTWWSWLDWIVLKWDLWIISVAWVLWWVNVEEWDQLRALIDNPWQTETNWAISQKNIWYVSENSDNKSTTLEADKLSDTKFPSVKSVWDWVVWLFAPKWLITASWLTQNTAKLLWRSTAWTGVVEELTLWTWLSFTGTTLNPEVNSSSTNTFTNKRITKRVVTTTQSATPTINTDNWDIFTITWLAQAITSFTTNLSWTPTAEQMMIINITDNWTARAITWWTSFEASTVALPTTTVISTLLKVWFIWNTVTSKWRCVAVA